MRGLRATGDSTLTCTRDHALLRPHTQLRLLQLVVRRVHSVEHPELQLMAMEDFDRLSAALRSLPAHRPTQNNPLCVVCQYPPKQDLYPLGFFST